MNQHDPLTLSWLEVMHIISYMLLYAAAFVLYCFGLDSLNSLDSYRYFGSATILASAGFTLYEVHKIDEE